MKSLTVLFDGNCGACRNIRWWLERQPQFVRLEFVVAGSQEALARFPEIRAEDSLSEIHVIADDGSYWMGARAWVTCLWALRKYRRWAKRLASPTLLPFAKRAMEMVSRRRHRLQSLTSVLLAADRERRLQP